MRGLQAPLPGQPGTCLLSLLGEASDIIDCPKWSHYKPSLAQGAGEEYSIAFSMQLRQGLPSLYNSTSDALADIADIAAQPGAQPPTRHKSCMLTFAALFLHIGYWSARKHTTALQELALQWPKRPSSAQA